MKTSFLRGAMLPISILVSVFSAQRVSSKDYTLELIAENLNGSTGIAAIRSSYLVYTKVPEPGISEGANAVF